MQYINYLETYQDIAYKIFYNAIKNNRLFHAYLLVGENGTPLAEVAKFIAASIILKEENEEPFEIEGKNGYDRILSNTFGDFVYLDAKNGSVKIDEIRFLEEKFSKTAEEKYGIKVAIINGVENLANDSSNALLKFLEEPLPDTYIFLLTENEFALLPTIKSRVQTIHFNNLSQELLLQEANEYGDLPKEAEILSFFYNDSELIAEKSQDETTIKLINLVVSTLEKAKNNRLVMNEVYNSVLKQVKDKITARLFFDYLIIFFKEALKFKNGRNTILKSYDNILKDLSCLRNLDNSIIVLMHSRNELNFNLNINLLIIETMKSIFGESKWITI